MGDGRAERMAQKIAEQGARFGSRRQLAAVERGDTRQLLRPCSRGACSASLRSPPGSGLRRIFVAAQLGTRREASSLDLRAHRRSCWTPLFDRCAHRAARGRTRQACRGCSRCRSRRLVVVLNTAADSQMLANRRDGAPPRERALMRAREPGKRTRNNQLSTRSRHWSACRAGSYWRRRARARALIASKHLAFEKRQRQRQLRARE